MSGKQKSVDPYAGQYPPPPPLPKHEAGSQQEPFYIIDPTIRHSFHEETAHKTTGSSHSIQDLPKSHFNEPSLHNEAVTDDAGYYDPDSQDLREYLYAERQQKLRLQQEKESEEHKQQEYQQLQEYQKQQEYRKQQEYQKWQEYQKQLDYRKQQEYEYKNQQEYSRQQDYPHNMDYHNQHEYNQPIMDLEGPYHQHGHPDSQYYNNNLAYQNEELLYPSPMMVQPMFHHQQSSALFSPPPHFIPPFPPMQTQPSNPSMVRPPPSQRRSGCCGLGISFCSCIWTMILVTLFLAGIGLIVAMKTIGDRCTDSVGTCGQVLHDGFLYGGIVIAGTSALIIVWRVLRWYGYTRRKQIHFTNTH